MVLLHGLSSDSSTWERFAGGLAARGRRALAPDLPGHGQSPWSGVYSLGRMRDEVIGLLDREGLGPVDLVGHSMGGGVAYLIAQEWPDRVRRLVIEETSPPPRAAPATPPTGFDVREPAEPLDFDWRAIEPIFTELRRPDPGWWDRLPAITARTLLVYGGPASHVSPAALAEVAEAIPDCGLVAIEDAGHRVHSIRPDEFWSVVAPFLG